MGTYRMELSCQVREYRRQIIEELEAEPSEEEITALYYVMQGMLYCHEMRDLITGLSHGVKTHFDMADMGKESTT